MEKLNDYELKKICLDILVRFDKICNEHNLRYSIAYGTLIGAVRHQGFIPWDDDIDVVMPRDDYEKLLKLNYEDNDYKILNYENAKYYYVYAKMVDKNTYLNESHRIEKDMGVFIDIFPVDYVNKDEFLYKKIKMSKSNKIILDKIGGKTNIENSKNIFSFCFKSFVRILIKPFRKILLKILDRRFICENGEYWNQFTYSSGCCEKRCFPVEFWDNIIEMNFENKKVKAFKDYDMILKNIYGDYMKLPPESEQKTHHNFVAYRK